MKHIRILLPVLTSLTFAGSFIAGKYALQDLDPLSSTLLRYIVAILVLSLLIFKYGKSSLKVARRDIWQMFVLGLLGVSIYHYFFFSSLIYAKAANSAIIMATNPIITGALAAIFLRERLGTVGYIGVFMAFVGVLALLTKGSFSALFSLQFNLGELLMLCGVICWAISALMIQNLKKRYSGFTLTYYAALFGTFQICFLVFLGDFWGGVSAMTMPSILAILYMGLFASGIGYYLFNLSIHKIGPTRTASSVYSLVPIFVAILGLLFFGESVTLIMVISTILIIVGLNFAMKERMKIK